MVNSCGVSLRTIKELTLANVCIKVLVNAFICEPDERTHWYIRLLFSPFNCIECIRARVV